MEDPELSLAEKKKALENLEQDAHQLMTASNEGRPRKAIMSLGMSRSLMRWSRPSTGSAKSRNTSQGNKRPIRGGRVRRLGVTDRCQQRGHPLSAQTSGLQTRFFACK